MMQKIKEFGNGPNNMERWVISTNTSDKADNGRNRSNS